MFKPIFYRRRCCIRIIGSLLFQIVYLRESSDDMVSEGIFTSDDSSKLKYKLEGKLKGMGHNLGRISCDTFR